MILRRLVLLFILAAGLNACSTATVAEAPVSYTNPEGERVEALGTCDDDGLDRLAVDLGCKEGWSIDQELDVSAHCGSQGVGSRLEGNDCCAKTGLSHQ